MNRNNTSWIISCDPLAYKIGSAFRKLEAIDWTVNMNASVGDIVYIYVNLPIQQILFKTTVIKINVKQSELIDDSDFIPDKNQLKSKHGKSNKIIRLKLIKKFDDKTASRLSMDELKKNGLSGSIQGPRDLSNNEPLLNYIEETERSNIKIEIKELSSIRQKSIGESEKEQSVKVRLTQGIFRDSLLMQYCQCKICGLKDKTFLIASHIKPWKDCTDEEKVDVNNGFLLCPSHDALFDKGYISFKEDGIIILSDKLDKETAKLLGVNESIKINTNKENEKYLKWHRKTYFEE